MRRHIFFDLDGTLTDSAPGILNSLRHAFAGFGLAPSEAVLRSYIGPPLRESFARHFSSAADVERAVSLYRAYFSERGLFENAVYPPAYPACSDVWPCRPGCIWPPPNRKSSR